ncbi:hypothetical protein ES702_01585 [subsurface metagenome]
MVAMSRPRMFPWPIAATTNPRRATQLPTAILVIVLTTWKYLQQALRHHFWLLVPYHCSLSLTLFLNLFMDNGAYDKILG